MILKKTDKLVSADSVTSKQAEGTGEKEDIIVTILVSAELAFPCLASIMLFAQFYIFFLFSPGP